MTLITSAESKAELKALAIVESTILHKYEACIIVSYLCDDYPVSNTFFKSFHSTPNFVKVNPWIQINNTWCWLELWLSRRTNSQRFSLSIEILSYLSDNNTLNQCYYCFRIGEKRKSFNRVCFKCRFWTDKKCHKPSLLICLEAVWGFPISLQKYLHKIHRLGISNKYNRNDTVLQLNDIIDDIFGLQLDNTLPEIEPINLMTQFQNETHPDWLSSDSDTDDLLGLTFTEVDNDIELHCRSPSPAPLDLSSKPMNIITPELTIIDEDDEDVEDDEELDWGDIKDEWN